VAQLVASTDKLPDSAKKALAPEPPPAPAAPAAKGAASKQK
jgi:hypothetical protein